MFLAPRSARSTHPGIWSIITGHLEDAERPGEALVREVKEETGMDVGKGAIQKQRVVKFDEYIMHLYVVLFPREQVFNLNWENDAAGWYSLNRLPAPRYPDMHFARLMALKALN